MNKKGIFFTILVIVILTLFFLSYTFFSVVQERKTIQKRIETMNSFLFSIEEDLQRKLFISGFRVIFLMNKRIIETGSYINDTNAVFIEAFFDGTIEGYSDSEIDLLMSDAKFSDIVSSIQSDANKINVNVTFSDNPVLNMTQDDPWNVKITFISAFLMEDLSGLASWNKTQVIVTYIPIEGFEDPTYFLEEGFPNSINRTQYLTFNNTAELQDHAQNTYYLNNTDAPSFLNRLEGNIAASSSCCGIESLAVPKLISLTDVSIVDHEYFLRMSGIQQSCMPGWFYIDPSSSHDVYEIC